MYECDTQLFKRTNTIQKKIKIKVVTFGSHKFGILF